MKTYSADQLVNLDSEQIHQIQNNCDVDALEYLDEKEEELAFLNAKEKEHLREYYTDTMEKYRLLYEAIVTGFSSRNHPGFPEHIYNINLNDGSIETDKNGRRINYSTEILAPCTTSILHYINHEFNDVYVVLPPIKDPERTIEKIMSERLSEHRTFKEEKLGFFEDMPEISFPISPEAEHICPTVKRLNRPFLATKNSLLKITHDDLLPRDIYRLSITSKYPGDLEVIIRELEKKFPDYIQFEKGERNLYKENLSENKRNYFDIKKSAKIKIPKSSRHFYIEFQFKQTNMFFAHIRSHSAYEEYRVIEAKYNQVKEAAKKKKNLSQPDVVAKLSALKKQSEEKRNLCLEIHRNAVHQSNLYLMHKLLWLDDNAHGLNRKPDNSRGQYQHSIDMLEKNYIVESYTPFDSATAFTTNENEFFNKAHYLKMINILPESFDELSKNAKPHINKAWENLSQADIKDFNRITSIAIKYQDVIRSIQKRREMMDTNTVLTVVAAQNER